MVARSLPHKPNPLRNAKAMNKLNPYAIVVKRANLLREEKKNAALLAKRKAMRQKSLAANKEKIKKGDARLKARIARQDKVKAKKVAERKKRASDVKKK